MTGRHWSSPFGARPLSAAPMLAEIALRQRQAALSRDQTKHNSAGVADKWQLLRALSEARGRLALSDRTICVLEALLSFHPAKEIDGARATIVFPSNRELSLRSRGMAPATLRRHLAALVAAGLVLRRDSPNGKRFRRADLDGEGEEAFGFDISPLALRAGAIFEAAEEERRMARALARLRSAVSLHRRDIRKIIEAALCENRRGDWTGLLSRMVGEGQGGSRRATQEELTELEARLVRLRAEVETAYLESLTNEEMSASDAENERHHQNSKPEPSIESNGHRVEEKGKTEAGSYPTTSPGGVASERLERKGLGFDLQTVLRLCPDIAAYGKVPPRSFADLLTAANLVRGFLGISQDAWTRACAAMGEIEAAVVIACMLQRSERIRSAGGYLRDLTQKAREGRFGVGPMLRALDAG